MIKFCISCGAQHDKRGNFCDPTCHKGFRAAKRNEIAAKKCRLCCRPGSPEEWAEFRRWRKEQRKQESLLRSEHTLPQETQPCQM